MQDRIARRSEYAGPELMVNKRSLERGSVRYTRGTINAREREELKMHARVHAFMHGEKIADVNKYLDGESRARLEAQNQKRLAARRRKEKVICALAVSMAVGMIVMTWMVAVVWHVQNHH